MTKEKKPKLNFEESLKQLEKIVDTMEKGVLDLDESLKTFAEGVALTQKCQEALKDAEQKVKILTGDKLVDFTSPDVDAEEDDDEEEEEDE
jgi:exodeoxyribonuclease VII small subunit